MRQGRISSLDGLRGVAALIVVIWHIALASTASGQAQVGLFAWSPLHLLWAGPEMVLIFFVLSGYVLALPVVNRGFAWFRWSYYPRRFVRLYLPAVAALVFAGALHVLIARHVRPSESTWLADQAIPVSVPVGLQDASLLSQPNTNAYTNVLWSLRWEVWFSLLLPAFVLLPVFTRSRPRIACVVAFGCLALIASGTTFHTGWWEYMPTFELGALLAFHAHRIPITSWKLGLVLCIGLLTMASWHPGSPFAETAGSTGGCLAVWLALVSPSRRLLTSSVAQWLGSRSYSLYLVHLPVVATLAFAAGGRPAVLWMLAIGLPCSLLVTEIFWHVVERRATQFAGAIRSGSGQSSSTSKSARPSSAQA